MTLAKKNIIKVVGSSSLVFDATSSFIQRLRSGGSADGGNVLTSYVVGRGLGESFGLFAWLAVCMMKRSV